MYGQIHIGERLAILIFVGYRQGGAVYNTNWMKHDFKKISIILDIYEKFAIS